MGLRKKTVQKLIVLFALGLSGCVGAEPGSVAAMRRIVGTDLIGAKGATPEDQRKINRTVVGLCGPQIWTVKECNAHGEAVNGGLSNN